MQCLGQNFAYNEMSFFLIRLLQKFSGFQLASDAQPAESQPPARWQGGKGRQAYERIWPASSVTAYVKVRGLVTMINKTITDMERVMVWFTRLQGGLWVRAEAASDDEGISD